MPVNHQLWQERPGEHGTIKAAQAATEVSGRQVLVRVHSWAINPCDALLQDRALPFIKYPVILGQDIAGVVVLAGSSAQEKFKTGDRVFGFTINNAFQEYAIVDHLLAAKIPPVVTFNEASIFGLCCTTSAFSLFSPDHLHLPLPSLNANPLQKSILIWGASSAVGSNAVQLAKGAGLKVFATCSSHNFEYVKNLGADRVFDYRATSVTDLIAAELDKDQFPCAGIYLATGDVASACQVSVKSRQQLLVSSTNPVLPGDCPDGVEAKMAFGTGGPDGFIPILPAVWGGFLVEALAHGKYQIAPRPQIVPTKGLEGIQVALNMLKAGVSATKLVVEANNS